MGSAIQAMCAAAGVAAVAFFGCATGNRSERIAALAQAADRERAATASLATELSTADRVALDARSGAPAERYHGGRGLVIEVDPRLDPTTAAAHACSILRAARLDRCEYRDATRTLRVSETERCAAELGELSVPVLLAIAIAASPELRGAELDLRLGNASSDEVRFVSVRHEPTRELFVEARERSGLPPVAGTPALDSDAISSRFGVGPLEDGSASWTADERAALVDALARLSERERLAVQGVPIRRDREPSPTQPKEEAGEYQLSIAPRGVSRRVVILDRAFEADETMFVGSVEAPVRVSSQVMLHEIGHAISLHEHFLRLQEVAARVEGFNDLVDQFNRLGRHVREREMSSFEEIRDAIESTQANLERVKVAAESREVTSTTLRAFSRITDSRRGPTPYGRTSPIESFAESFALYHVDPDALRRFSPEVFGYFASGQHVASLPVPSDTSEVTTSPP